MREGDIVTNSKSRPAQINLPAILSSLALGAGLVASAHFAGAANVSGTMVYRNGSPATQRQLHYENRATGDMYVAPTTPDGSFTADIPPGHYDLRAERGVILKNKIIVGDEDFTIGRVVEPAPLDVRRLFEHQNVAEAIVISPAPSTANLTGRPMQAMRYGHESVAGLNAPSTPVPESTPLGEMPNPTPTPRPRR
jgi:hypothetical protein